MIELRFEERRVSIGRAGTAKILQQRTKTRWVDGSTTNNVHYGWTEWKDVPVVQEK